MEVRIEEGWKEALVDEFEKPYFGQLAEYVRSEYERGVCYPPAAEIFRAFDLCPYARVKAVILGQDPYHEPGQAEGLCFSVPQGIVMPPSLRNIFREIGEDLGRPLPTDGSLERWARQGVLLLNATLSVRQGAAGSHQGKGWEVFTDEVIARLSQTREHLVFMLWGAYARSKNRLIDHTRHLVLEAAHPSPLSANRGGWFGCRHFSQANNYLKENGQEPIEW